MTSTTATGHYRTFVTGPPLPAVLKSYAFLQCVEQKPKPSSVGVRTRSQHNAPPLCYYDPEEINGLPAPDDLADTDCGVCYSCFQMRGKPCPQSGKLAHQAYVSWHSNLTSSSPPEVPTSNKDVDEEEEEIPEECPGCETGCDADGPHRIFNGEYHPNCCTRAAEEERSHC